ncbi:MAG: hypothetical protein J6Y70_00530 [Bacilli bacterium]|nr:hypothetical protein [Bacilli bacterium]
MKRHGKKYEAIKKLIDKTKTYSLEEAVNFFKTSNYNFDQSLNLCLYMKKNNKRAKTQSIRGTVVLPYGNGKQKKILVISEYEVLAKQCGADIVGGKEIVDKILLDKTVPQCDIIVADFSLMPYIAKIASILKKLMPNPKNGTIVTSKAELSNIIKEIKNGKIEYRLEKEHIRLSFAKMSFSIDKIKKNFEVVLDTISSRHNLNFEKNNFFYKIFVNATMSPAVRINFVKNGH